jgi:hypothetical protein
MTITVRVRKTSIASRARADPHDGAAGGLSPQPASTPIRWSASPDTGRVFRLVQPSLPG